MRMLLVRIMSAIYKKLYNADFGKDAEKNLVMLCQNEALKSRVAFLEAKLASRNKKLVEIMNNFSKMMYMTDAKLDEVDLIRDVEITEIKKMFGGGD